MKKLSGLLVFFYLIFNTFVVNATVSETELKQVEQGDAQAQIDLGKKYFNAQGVTRDEEKAAKLFQQSAAQGNPEGQYFLGKVYDLGAGILESNEQSIEWYKKSANQGYVLAQVELGRYYYKAQQYDLSEKWLQKAADQNNGTAKQMLMLKVWLGLSMS